MTLPLYYQSATELLRRFKDRTLSPVELMQATIDRAGSVEPAVNALSYTFYEEALEKARRAEQAWRKGGARPLEGLPVAVKDEAAVEGQITSNGSLIWKDNVMPFTEAMVQRLIDAGAIVHARSAVPEFSVNYAVWSKLHGVTHNPWSPEYFTGGSSGGSGAALASGTATLATGSDLAGSIRMPASNCGVVGFKPPYARVPKAPGTNLETYGSSGPMTRTVDDCILMQNVIAGPHPMDIASIAPKLTLPTDYENIEGMRIAYSPDLGYCEVEPDVARNTERALDVLKDAGAVVEEVVIPWTTDAERHYQNHLCGVGIRTLRSFVPEGSEHLLTDYVRWWFEQSESVTLDDEVAAVAYRVYMTTSIGEVFSKHDALVCPTMSSVRIPVDYDFSHHDHIEINGRKTHCLWGATMTYPFNVLNQCPVLNVPTGLAGNNVPTGMQIVAPGYRDEVAFRVGKAYEAAAGRFIDAANQPAFGSG